MSGLAACATSSGDFCLVAEPLRPNNQEIATIMFEKDRELVKKIAKHNKLGEEKCGWEIKN